MATTSGGLLVISPHFDDAVLSCGELLARRPGSTVATVCGGRPLRRASTPEWDVDCGFAGGDDVMAIRVGEDWAALEILGARQVVLTERDMQYHPHPGRQRRVTRALANLLEAVEPEECALPIGIGHPDHILARSCCLTLAEKHPWISWRAYTDLPYGASPRFRHAERSARESIADAGFILEPLPSCRDEAARRLKQRAMACYPSQIRGLTSSRTNFILSEQTTVEASFRLTGIRLPDSPRLGSGGIDRSSDHRSQSLPDPALFQFRISRSS